LTLLFGGLIEGVFGLTVFSIIGFLYLYVRYRNRMQVRRALVKEYESSYANAGQVVALNTVAAIGILLVVGLLGTLIWYGMRQ
jgi:hypothetical protein